MGKKYKDGSETGWKNFKNILELGVVRCLMDNKGQLWITKGGQIRSSATSRPVSGTLAKIFCLYLYSEKQEIVK